MVSNLNICVLLAGLFCAAGGAANADAPCVDFKWDVIQERALFAGPAEPLTAGSGEKSAPAMWLNHLYQIKLLPEDQVVLAAAPGKAPPISAKAGILTFKLAASGSYRIALDMPVWIDIVANGALIRAKDFQGQHACAAPHKILEFDLIGTRPFFLQLSGAADSVNLSITTAPARKL